MPWPWPIRDFYHLLPMVDGDFPEKTVSFSEATNFNGLAGNHDNQVRGNPSSKDGKHM